jgi:hypothetical protein
LKEVFYCEKSMVSLTSNSLKYLDTERDSSVSFLVRTGKVRKEPPASFRV